MNGRTHLIRRGAPPTAAVLAALMALGLAARAPAADESISAVMGSINIEPGQHAADVSDVNGSVHVGSGAVVSHVSTVNGSIIVADHVSAASLGTVNGSIRVGAEGRVTGAIQTVNGAVEIQDGSDVAGSLSTVNGPVRVVSSHVGGGVTTVNGGVDIGANSRVEGGIYMPRNDGGWFGSWFSAWFENSSHRTPPRIVIGPSAVVGGTLRFEQAVKLYVSDRATIGPVQGATAIRFSGDRPPD